MTHAQLDLFGAPAAPPPPPVVEISRSARFGGEPGPDGKRPWRLVLRRWWGEGRVCLWLMLNPSTADADSDDPSLSAMIAFTRNWGFAGLAVVNLYPVISPDPAVARAWAADAMAARDALQQNLETIERVAARADLLVCAWGAGAWDPDWIAVVLAHVRAAAPELVPHCIGVTESGAPKHPLARGHHRVPRDRKPEPWGMAA